MKWFKSPAEPDQALPETKDEKIKKLLKTSGSDFQFDQKPTKYRLMTSIAEADQKPARHFHFGRVAKYSVSFAAFVMLLSTTFAFAFNSKPGDAMFALNKLGEQAVLSLPLSVEQQANVESYIVTSRLQALDQVKVQPDQTNKKLEAKNLAAVKETDDSFASAVDNISKNQKALEASGKTEMAAKLNDALDKLQIETQKHEAKIKALEDQTTDKATKTKIRAHLSQLRANGQKAREQIKRFQNLRDKKDSSDKARSPEPDTSETTK